MLLWIELTNFKSFGDTQRVPLEPITVLVGPNNTGKSCFMSVARFIANAAIDDEAAISLEGGADFLCHRPMREGDEARIAWGTDAGMYRMRMTRQGEQLVQLEESLLDASGQSLWPRMNSGDIDLTPSGIPDGTPFTPRPCWTLRVTNTRYLRGIRQREGAIPFLAICGPMLGARIVHLSLEALRTDADVVPEPSLASDGLGLAAVLALWRGSEPEKAAELDAFLQACIPDLRHALVRPSPLPGKQRLWFRHASGELFDADHVSDGVLVFTALAMHIIAAGPHSVLFIEEPEHSIHPRRLGDLVELMRRAVDLRGCQFVLATHSPILLNEFRDQPEAIVRFQRSAAHRGTVVQCVADDPALVEALQQSDPGSLHADGFFDYPMA